MGGAEWVTTSGVNAAGDCGGASSLSGVGVAMWVVASGVGAAEWVSTSEVSAGEWRKASTSFRPFGVIT